MAFSSPVVTSFATGVARHSPLAARSWRSTVTAIESERNARDRTKTVTRSRSPVLPRGAYQSVMRRPDIGSSEPVPAKCSVSSAACHNSGLTCSPVCGPIARCEGLLARPRTVHSVASVSGSLVSAAATADCGGATAAGGGGALTGPPGRSAGRLLPQPAAASERLAASASPRR